SHSEKSQRSSTSSQVSTLQSTLSAQTRGVPEQVPFVQTSFTVQNWPSSHGDGLFGCVHWPSVQMSSVHTLVSAVHCVPFGCWPSAGHPPALPVQFSATSHSPVAARHTVVEGRNASVGQPALLPVQFSAVSHTPLDGRHSSVDGWNASIGQVADDPVQFSGVSQTPPDARHSVVEGTKE